MYINTQVVFGRLVQGFMKSKGIFLVNIRNMLYKQPCASGLKNFLSFFFKPSVIPGLQSSPSNSRVMVSSLT